MRREIPLGEKDALVIFDVQKGRRTEPLAETATAEIVRRHEVARHELLKRLNSVTGSDAVRDLAKSREKTEHLRLRSKVGFQPVISTLPEGSNMTATAVISADRRYVRITTVPLFSVVGEVSTFNFSTGMNDPPNPGPGHGHGHGHGHAPPPPFRG